MAQYGIIRTLVRCQKEGPITPTSNPCSRCGQERIVAKTWDEHIEVAGGTSVIKHTTMVCPDPECQRHVEQDILKQQQKREAVRLAKEQRDQKRQRSNATTQQQAS